MDKYNIHTFEKFLIPSEYWTDAMLGNFPDEIKRELQQNEYPMGIGHHNEVGWFCLGAGQGPFWVWTQKE